MDDDTAPALDGGRVTGSTGSVELVTGDGPAVPRVTGALDLAQAPLSRQSLDRAVRPGDEVLVIDLSAVDFLAPAGMPVLVRAHRERAAMRAMAGGRVVLRPLEMTRPTDEPDSRPPLAEAAAGR